MLPVVNTVSSGRGGGGNGGSNGSSSDNNVIACLFINSCSSSDLNENNVVAVKRKWIPINSLFERIVQLSFQSN